MVRLGKLRSTLAAGLSAVYFALSQCRAAFLGCLSLLGREILLLRASLSPAAILGSIALLFPGLNHLDSEQGSLRSGQRRSLISLVGWCNP